MTEKYYHLSALVQGCLKDMLVHEDVLEGNEPADFFLFGAENVTVTGAVHLETEKGNHALPDIFG